MSEKPMPKQGRASRTEFGDHGGKMEARAFARAKYQVSNSLI